MLKKMQDDLGYEDDAGSEECGRFYSPEEMGDVFEHVNYGMLVDEIENLPEKYRDQIQMRKIRFRTLGCWPLTGAVESEADTIEKIVEEMMTTTKSERTTRVIDFDQDASMEQKKREGYF